MVSANQCRCRFKAGRRINVYVGERPNLDQVFFAFPLHLLEYFAPALRNGIRNMSKDCKPAVVVLPELKRSAVAWYLHFAMAGGKLKQAWSFDLDSVDVFVARLRVLLTLGSTGVLIDQATKRLYDFVIKGVIQWHLISWLFQEASSGSIGHTMRELASKIHFAVISGAMVRPLAGARSNHLFSQTMTNLVQDSITVHIVGKKQHAEKIPLTSFQVEYLYSFSVKGSRIRECAVRGIARLMDEGYITNGKVYNQYSDISKAFKADLTAAWERQLVIRKHQISVKERNAKRATRAAENEQRKNDRKAPAVKTDQEGTGGQSLLQAEGALAGARVPAIVNKRQLTQDNVHRNRKDEHAHKHNCKLARKKPLVNLAQTPTPTASPVNAIQSTRSKYAKRNTSRKQATSKADSAGIPPVLKPAKRLELAVVLSVKSDGTYQRTVADAKGASA
jgi:hypothetical protein